MYRVKGIKPRVINSDSIFILSGTEVSFREVAAHARN